MSTKTVLILYVQSALIQLIACQCIGNGLNNMIAPGFAGGEGMGWGGPGFGYGPMGAPFAPGPMIAPEWTPLGPANVPSSNGGGFFVTSSSPIAPVGVSVISDNEYTGPLAVGGQLPFLGTVGLEGALPSTGTGAVTYGCGNGNIGMVSEAGAEMAYANGLAPGYGFAPGFPGANYGFGAAGFGINSLNRCETI
ncbi:unnamed protein product, partial [Iphiclides podalirius]